MIYRKNLHYHDDLMPTSGFNDLSRMGKIFVIIFFVVILEGAFRKWVSPNLTLPLVLLRDLLAIYSIIFAINIQRHQSRKVIPVGLLIWTIFIIIWGLLQYSVNNLPFLIYLIGLRFWLLYLWFAFAMGQSLTKYDFIYISRMILITLIIMTPLVVTQSFLPPGSFLNKDVEGDESAVFLLSAEIVRTTGTFSFTLGFATFMALAIPFAISIIEQGKYFWRKNWMAMLCFSALTISTLVTGSRASLLMFIAFLFLYVLGLVVYTRKTIKLSTWFSFMVIGVVIFAVLLIFDRSIVATQERIETAAQVEDVYERFMTVFSGEAIVSDSFTLIGHGIGAGNNFAAVYTGGERSFQLGETEVSRILLEGGLVGIAFILFKYIFTFVGLRKAFRVAKVTSNLLPLMIWGVIGIAFFSWSIIGQLTVNALAYILLSLGISSLRLFPPITLKNW